MAFVNPTPISTHHRPSLSIPSSKSSTSIHTHNENNRNAVRLTVRATNNTGRISVSRHRRLYDFYTQATTVSSPSTSIRRKPSSSSSSSPSSSPVAAINAVSTRSVADIRKNVLLRHQQIQRQLEESDIIAKAKWIESLASLKTSTSKTTSQSINFKVSTPQPTTSDVPLTLVTSDPSVSLPPSITADEVLTTSVVEDVVSTAEVPTATTSAADTVSLPVKSPEPIAVGDPASVSELYGPSSKQEFRREVAEKDTSLNANQSPSSSTNTVADLYSAPVSKPFAERSVSTPESVAEVQQEDIKQKEDKGIVEPNQEVDGVIEQEEGSVKLDEIMRKMEEKLIAVEDSLFGQKEDEGDKKPLGQALLEVITEGVPSVDKGEESVNEDTSDKSQIISLVDTGKIKKLTVSKLKRLLSAHNLKTSGRKSELVARLTSFVKK